MLCSYPQASSGCCSRSQKAFMHAPRPLVPRAYVTHETRNHRSQHANTHTEPRHPPKRNPHPPRTVTSDRVSRTTRSTVHRPRTHLNGQWDNAIVLFGLCIVHVVHSVHKPELQLACCLLRGGGRPKGWPWLLCFGVVRCFARARGKDVDLLTPKLYVCRCERRATILARRHAGCLTKGPAHLPAPPLACCCSLATFALHCSPWASKDLILPSSRLLRRRHTQTSTSTTSTSAPVSGHSRRGAAAAKRALLTRLRGASERAAHMSPLINSMRLETLFLTSSSSCFTSTGPISLNTLASSSRMSSSCTGQRMREGAHAGEGAQRSCTQEPRGRAGGAVHLEDKFILQDLCLCRRDVALHLADLGLDGAVRVELRLQRIPAGHCAKVGTGRHKLSSTSTWAFAPLPARTRQRWSGDRRLCA